MGNDLSSTERVYAQKSWRLACIACFERKPDEASPSSPAECETLLSERLPGLELDFQRVRSQTEEDFQGDDRRFPNPPISARSAATPMSARSAATPVHSARGIKTVDAVVENPANCEFSFEDHSSCDSQDCIAAEKIIPLFQKKDSIAVEKRANTSQVSTAAVSSTSGAFSISQVSSIDLDHLVDQDLLIETRQCDLHQAAQEILAKDARRRSSADGHEKVNVAELMSEVAFARQQLVDIATKILTNDRDADTWHGGVEEAGPNICETPAPENPGAKNPRGGSPETHESDSALNPHAANKRLEGLCGNVPSNAAESRGSWSGESRNHGVMEPRASRGSLGTAESRGSHAGVLESGEVDVQRRAELDHDQGERFVSTTSDVYAYLPIDEVLSDFGPALVTGHEKCGTDPAIHALPETCDTEDLKCSTEAKADAAGSEKNVARCSVNSKIASTTSSHEATADLPTVHQGPGPVHINEGCPAYCGVVAGPTPSMRDNDSVRNTPSMRVTPTMRDDDSVRITPSMRVRFACEQNKRDGDDDRGKVPDNSSDTEESDNVQPTLHHSMTTDNLDASTGNVQGKESVRVSGSATLARSLSEWWASRPAERGPGDDASYSSCDSNHGEPGMGKQVSFAENRKSRMSLSDWYDDGEDKDADCLSAKAGTEEFRISDEQKRLRRGTLYFDHNRVRGSSSSGRKSQFNGDTR